MNSISLIPNFISNSHLLFEQLRSTVIWDERMKSRKTASYGVAYNYSQIHYPKQSMLPELKTMSLAIEKELGFLPNNCLINYYPDGKSKMGFHSDQTEIMEKGTGVAIVSLGSTRSIVFRNSVIPSLKKEYELPSGSLFYMTAELQHTWQHAIPKTDTHEGRISLTFRKLITELSS